MVGIVIVSHSRKLADGARELAMQMSGGKEVRIAAVGGLQDGSLGTSFDDIGRAVKQAYSDDGLLIIMDLGSAVMTAEMVLETLPPEQRERVRLSNAPLVEGAVAAASAVAAGQPLDQVKRAAEAALTVSKVDHRAEVPDSESKPEQIGPDRSVDLIVRNPVGLHARPAIQFVQTAARFQARIELQNVSRNRAPVDGKMPLQVAFGGTARQGETIRITATGADAGEALDALKALVESGFEEMGQPVAPIPEAETLPPERQVRAQEPPSGKLKGLPVSEGYAVAPALVYRPDKAPQTGKPGVRAGEGPEHELSRLRTAIGTVKDQISRLQGRVAQEADERSGRIFGFQRLILDDPQLVNQMEHEILTRNVPAERAIEIAFGHWLDLASQSDEVMKMRAADLSDVRNHLLDTLSGTSYLDTIKLTEPAIIVAAELTPSETARLDRSLVKGLATTGGGVTSHTAILARTWGLPSVMGLDQSVLDVPDGTILALDGRNGVVDIEPSQETIASYKEQAKEEADFRARAMAQVAEPAVMADGRRIVVLANAGDMESVRVARANGADGIGLLRTEFLFLNRSKLPDEEEQYQAYRAILDLMHPRPVIIRTLDIGGDKPLPYLDLAPELNPFLGVRAVRLCLKRPDIFRTQLRAILRAGADRHIKIMFPMVATVEELGQAKSHLAEAVESLSSRGMDRATDLEVGIMIETPAAAIKADLLAREVDFFSIGSNDLTQYAMACDRGNDRLAYLYNPWDLAVLRLIKGTVDAAHAAGRWVGLCGEFAAMPQALPLLVGLGLDELSVGASSVPLVKQRIRELHMAECTSTVERFLGGA